MPLFTTELNELADRIGRSNLVIRLHTAAPTNGSPTNARVYRRAVARYGTGATVTAANISSASNGDIEITADIDFGTATADVGTVTHWSAYRGTDPVAFGTLPSTVISSGDSFKINANTSGHQRFHVVID